MAAIDASPSLPRRVRRAPSTGVTACAFVLLATLASACGEATGVEAFGAQNLMDVSVCDPEAGGFTSEIDNPYFPLPAGQVVVLEGGGSLVRITSLEEVRTVAGVETRVVEEYEEVGGQLVEISRNFFAQAQDGTVCYFGEEVDMYDEEGNVSSHAGAWVADGDTLLPGIFMPASPQVDQAFAQEMAPGIAEDRSRVVAVGEVAVLPGGTFEETVTMIDLDPLSGGQDRKVYAKGIGLVVDETAQLTEFVQA